MLHEMSNKAFLRLLALIITVIVCIGLLWVRPSDGPH